MVDAVNRRDPDAFVNFCAPDVVWEENTLVVPGLPSVSHGPVEVRRWFHEVTESWSEVELTSEFEEVGDDCLVVEHRFRATGRISGVEARLTFWEATWLRDSKVRRRMLFIDEADARAAASQQPPAPA